MAYGEFEATGTDRRRTRRKYTRAKLFQEAGKKTPMVIRFSTVIGGRDSSEVARDPRGFAVKFYTEDGNWDLVGNNLPVFFIRDAIKFPDVIHSLKPDPVTFRQEANRIFDFMSQTPEAQHMLTFLFSPRGIPKRSYRHQEGYGVNTYKMVNADGQTVIVKYHFHPQCGVHSFTDEEAGKVQAKDLGSASKDLFDAIKKGDFPKWDMFVQIMSDDEHPELDWDPLDDTKIWPEDQFPLRKVGTMTLNRNVENFFAENEQIAMGTGVLVDGLDFSDDKMLVGRTFSYSDTQRHRVGTNYLQLKVNSPQGITHPVVPPTSATARWRSMWTWHGQNPHVNYEPSIHGGLKEIQRRAGPIHQPEIHGKLTRSVIDRRNDYAQARGRFVTMNDWEREDLVKNMGNLLAQCEKDVQQRMLWHFYLVHDDYGSEVANAIGLTAKDVRHLKPLAKQVLTEEDQQRLENLGSNGDHMDKSKYGKHTGSVETFPAKAEDLLMMAQQPDPRYVNKS